jgi:hypothetical protein
MQSLQPTHMARLGERRGNGGFAIYTSSVAFSECFCMLTCSSRPLFAQNVPLQERELSNRGLFDPFNGDEGTSTVFTSSQSTASPSGGGGVDNPTSSPTSSSIAQSTAVPSPTTFNSIVLPPLFPPLSPLLSSTLSTPTTIASTLASTYVPLLIIAFLILRRTQCNASYDSDSLVYEHQKRGAFHLDDYASPNSFSNSDADWVCDLGYVYPSASKADAVQTQAHRAQARTRGQSLVAWPGSLQQSPWPSSQGPFTGRGALRVNGGTTG